METKYYKDKDGKFLKLDYRYNEYPESPLNPNFQTNLGTMICKDMKNYALGNVQVKDWEEYFRSELSDDERFKASLIHNDYEDPSLYGSCYNPLYGSCYNTYVAYMKEYGTPGDTVNFTTFVDEIFPNKNGMIEYLQKDQTLLREYRKFDEEKEDHLIDKYIDKADKLYGQYMYKYLKDLDVLDNKARDRKIADYEKKHDASRSR